MSPKGNYRDNAPTESGFISFGNERMQDVRHATHAQIKATAFEWIEVFCNGKRQLSALGYRSPVRSLEHCIRKQLQEKRAA